MKIPCEKCDFKEKEGLQIVTEEGIHGFCRTHIKQALDNLRLMPFKNKDVRALEKKLRRYINEKAN